MMIETVLIVIYCICTLNTSNLPSEVRTSIDNQTEIENQSDGIVEIVFTEGGV